MYRIQKRLEIAGSHKLNLPYESKCKNLHGHNWIINIYCEAKELNAEGMVIDFTHIKQEISDKLDHSYVNEVININPTAENIAHWICDRINDVMTVGRCYKVSVQESEGNIAEYYEEWEDYDA